MKPSALAAVVMLGTLLGACGSSSSSGDWYYHWKCNGDSQCLATNPTGQPEGTLNEGPVESNCRSLQTFSLKFWGRAAVDSCDHSPTGGPGGGGQAPTIAGFTPLSGAAGTTVTITGTNLTGATVSINGVAAAVTSATATQLVISIPAMSSTFTGSFTVTTSGGTVTSSGSFTVVAGGTTSGSGGEVFVTGQSTASIDVYGRTANGNAAPLRAIKGGLTQLTGNMGGVSLDATHGELFVVNASGILLVFARAASGNVAPLRTLQVGAGPVRVDPAHGEVAVGTGDTVKVYSSNATGTQAPLRTLRIESISSRAIYDLAIDTVNDELLVLLGNSTSDPLVVLAFARTDQGSAGAKRVLTAFPGQATIFAGLAIDNVHDELWVTSTSYTSGSKVFARAGGDTPLRTTASFGSAIYVDATNDEVGLANAGDPNNSGAHPAGFTVLTRSTLSPLRITSGSQTGLDGIGGRIALGL